MQLRQLGTTGLTVSRLGLGLAALGRPGYINLGHADDLRQHVDPAALEAHCHAVLEAAWQRGVRYFDAARSYGKAEAFLASWLTQRRIDPAAVTVGSKWGYTYTAGWNITADRHEVKDHSLPVLQRQTAESQALLGAQLDLYQIHSATLESGVLDNAAILGELARLRDQGTLIGLSLTGPNQAEVLHRALDIHIGGTRLFACVQATWNLLEPSAGPALQTAHAAGLGVIVKEALANGRLTDRNNDSAFAARRQLLAAAAAQRATTLPGLALAAALAQPWADVILSGAATVAHLEANVKALAVPWDAALGEQLGAVAEAPAAYWTARGQLAWN